MNILIFQDQLKKLDNVKTIACKLKFIDRFRFMSTSLTKLVDNLSELHRKKCRDKNCKSEYEFKGLEGFVMIAKSLDKKKS